MSCLRGRNVGSGWFIVKLGTTRRTTSERDKATESWTRDSHRSGFTLRRNSLTPPDSTDVRARLMTSRAPLLLLRSKIRLTLQGIQDLRLRAKSSMVEV
jgi:hypothetical protein